MEMPFIPVGNEKFGRLGNLLVADQKGSPQPSYSHGTAVVVASPLGLGGPPKTEKQARKKED
jgi:hypothetical protein